MVSDVTTAQSLVEFANWLLMMLIMIVINIYPLTNSNEMDSYIFAKNDELYQP